MLNTTDQDLLYIWLDTNPSSSEADATIEDIPGVSDLDLIAEAMLSGHLGRYLPGTIHFAEHPQPVAAKIRSVDTARMLRERGIAHRRRYEIIRPVEQD